MTVLVQVETSAHGLVTAKYGEDKDLQITSFSKQEAIEGLQRILQQKLSEGSLALIELNNPRSVRSR